jgi:hypothetical protein
MVERRSIEARKARLAEAKSEIAIRVRRVCASLSEAEFDELVTRMAEIEIRYVMRREDDSLGPAAASVRRG